MIQLQFLNKLLDSKDTSLLLLNNLNKEFFSDYTQEYQFIEDHIKKYGTCPDKISFLSRFPEFDVIQVNEPSNYLIDELVSDYNKRKLAKVFNKVRELLNRDKTDEAMSVYLSAVNDVVKSVKLDAVDIFHDVSRFDKYIEKTRDFEKFYVKTGFKELDSLIGGWDREEELATIVARPGVGKSWVLHKVALAAAEQGLQVGIYSGEMSEVKVGYRIDTLISHIPNYSIMRGNDSIQLEYKKYVEELPTKFTGTIKVLTPAMINGVAGVNALRAFIEKEHLDLLCVDQHSLLEDDRRSNNPVERAANISRDLKNLQVLKHIPIIAVSQQNRDRYEEGQTTANVAQSDRISQDSTVLIFLSQQNNVLTLNLVKTRDAATGKKLQYVIDLNRGIFTFVPDENSDNLEKVSQDLKEDFHETGDDNTF